MSLILRRCLPILTQKKRLVFILLLIAIGSSLMYAPLASAQPEGVAEPGISTYWPRVVRRWESVILKYADARDLDPDLIAAVIWKESRGRPEARSVVGAVGLMGLMPFEWRPSPSVLEDPDVNLFWGARALAHTIRDGEGDIFYALAAYNGGWDQIHIRVTRQYATSVMDSYSRAVAVRHGLAEDGNWVALFAASGEGSSDTITVLGPHRPLARYTRRPWVQADIPAVPKGVPPHAMAVEFVDQKGQRGRVGVWLLSEDGAPIRPEQGDSVEVADLSGGSLLSLANRYQPGR